MDNCKLKHLNLGKHGFKTTQHYSTHIQCDNLPHSMGKISEFLFRIFQSMTLSLRTKTPFLHTLEFLAFLWFSLLR